jgi:hypothetical protein
LNVEGPSTALFNLKSSAMWKQEPFVVSVDNLFLTVVVFLRILRSENNFTHRHEILPPLVQPLCVSVSSLSGGIAPEDNAYGP